MDEIVLIERLFESYAAQFARALADPPEVDIEATASAFADCFVESGPRGVRCGRNDETFRAAIPQGYAFYRQIGIRDMAVATLAPSQLDTRHWGVRVGWYAAYDQGTRVGTVETMVTRTVAPRAWRQLRRAWSAGARPMPGPGGMIRIRGITASRSTVAGIPSEKRAANRKKTAGSGPAP